MLKGCLNRDVDGGQLSDLDNITVVELNGAQCTNGRAIQNGAIQGVKVRDHPFSFL